MRYTLFEDGRKVAESEQLADLVGGCWDRIHSLQRSYRVRDAKPGVKWEWWKVWSVTGNVELSPE